MMATRRWRVRARRATTVLFAGGMAILGLTGYLVTVALAAEPPPTVAITYPVSASSYRAATWTSSIAGTAVDADGVASVEVALFQHATGRYWDGTGFTSTIIDFNAAAGTTSWSYAIAGSLPDGQYTTSVKATDSGDPAAMTAPAQYRTSTFLLDNAVPVAPTLTSSPPSSTRTTTAAFAFRHSDRSVAFSCRMDGGPAVNCDGATARDGLGNITYPDLSIARHCFAVFATDPAGNNSTARIYCWTITPSPAAVNVFAGSPQDTFLNTAYPTALQARVVDASGNPQIGLAVTFTAPSGGVASGRFNSAGCPNTLVCTVLTGAGGVATAPPFTANNVAGAFSVNATVVAVASPAVFQLTNAARFDISGSLANPLYPGTGQELELTFTNPNPTPITIAAGDVGIDIVVNGAAALDCPATPNFSVTQTLTVALTIPANTLTPMTLTQLGIAPSAWPRIDMVETGVNQDACKNATLTLNYSAGATG